MDYDKRDAIRDIEKIFKNDNFALSGVKFDRPVVPLELKAGETWERCEPGPEITITIKLYERKIKHEKAEF